MATRLAPAKVNLFLHVGAPGADGYHPLCSLMVFADIGDRVSIAPAAAMDLTVMGPFAGGLDATDSNLVLRAAKALADALGGQVDPVAFALDKQLPVASGLGGGSSDAGAALRLMRDGLRLPASDPGLEAVAASLGADGAACLWARPVLAEGRGERLSAVAGLPVIDAVLVNPGVAVSTVEVYRQFDAAGGFSDVTPPVAPEAFDTVQELGGWLSRQRNDLEAPAVQIAPDVGLVLEMLRAEPETLLARVSGSGGTCFALCADDIQAESLAERIKAMVPHWWVRRCRLGGPWE